MKKTFHIDSVYRPEGMSKALKEKAENLYKFGKKTPDFYEFPKSAGNPFQKFKAEKKYPGPWPVGSVIDLMEMGVQKGASRWIMKGRQGKFYGFGGPFHQEM